MNKNEEFNKFILDMYDAFKSGNYSREELLFQQIKVQSSNFIGRIYIGNSSPVFSEIEDLNKYLDIFSIDVSMVYLNSSINHKEFQIYEYEYKSHEFKNNKVIIELKNGKTYELLIK